MFIGICEQLFTNVKLYPQLLNVTSVDNIVTITLKTQQSDKSITSFRLTEAQFRDLHLSKI